MKKENEKEGQNDTRLGRGRPPVTDGASPAKGSQGLRRR